MADKNDILLKEYETCQSYINALGSQFWVSVTIFMSINIAVLGGIIYGIIQNNGVLPKNTEFLVLIIGTGLILISWFLKAWQRRVSFLINFNNIRMRDIEDELAIENNSVMCRNWVVAGLDEAYCGQLNKIRSARKDARIAETKNWLKIYRAEKQWPEKHTKRRLKQIGEQVWLIFWLPIENIVKTICSIRKPIIFRNYIPPYGDLVISLIFCLIIAIWGAIIGLSFTLFN
jgi:hypothetical protein